MTSEKTTVDEETTGESARRSFRKLNPELVKFNVPGDAVEGGYIGSREMQFQNGPAIRYTLKADDGTIYVFFGSAIIDSLFESIEPGTYVRVTFQGQDHTTAGQALKLYDVEVAED